MEPKRDELESLRAVLEHSFENDFDERTLATFEWCLSCEMQGPTREVIQHLDFCPVAALASALARLEAAERLGILLRVVERAAARRESARDARSSSFGIAVDKDAAARRWQRYDRLVRKAMEAAARLLGWPEAGHVCLICGAYFPPSYCGHVPRRAALAAQEEHHE